MGVNYSSYVDLLERYTAGKGISEAILNNATQ